MAEVAGQSVRYGQVNLEYGMELATTKPADDGPIWMVNLMSYRERADYADGRAADISGREADDRYAPLGPLAAVGAEPVFLADVESQLHNDSPTWHRVGIVKYPTRRSFIEMQQRPDFKELHAHKEAGMATTIVMGCLPMPLPDPSPGAPALAEFTRTRAHADPTVVVVHAVRFHDHSRQGELASYTDRAAATPDGGRITACMRVEGTILGDGRSWDEVRFEVFPSSESFMTTVVDADRDGAQTAKRESAVADSYTLITRPVIDRLHASLEGHHAPYPSQP